MCGVAGVFGQGWDRAVVEGMVQGLGLMAASHAAPGRAEALGALAAEISDPRAAARNQHLAGKLEKHPILMKLVSVAYAMLDKACSLFRN